MSEAIATVWLTQEQIAFLFGIQRPAVTKHYNLDAILSVGYRINTKVATKFRQLESDFDRAVKQLTQKVSSEG